MACKFFKQKKQVSYDDGVTWIDVTPAEYQKGSLYEYDSADCPDIDYSTHYLTFVANEDAQFTFQCNDVYYSLDSGSTWTLLYSGVNTPTILAGSSILWKANLTPTVTSGMQGIGRFTSTGKFDIEGNVMSLLYGDSFQNQRSLSGKDYAFNGLFTSNSVVNANNLILPATTLSKYCYKSMFAYCSNLISVPKLPATTLAEECYRRMFADSTSLTKMPNLPATTLAKNCYESMFNGCTSLSIVYNLPATVMAEGCYGGMFGGCTSLVTAPSLPATTLAKDCYGSMFVNCSSLNNVTCLATNISATHCTTDWLYNVAASGTFTKTSSMSSWTIGSNGIPNGWTVQNYNS